MVDRDEYVAKSFEKLEAEYRKIIQGNSFKTKIKKFFSIQFLKNKLNEKIKTFKCRVLNLSEQQVESNNMVYRTYKGKKKIAIYVCVTGKYDEILEPYYIDKNCDYYLFTDQDVKSDIYTILDIPQDIKRLNNNILINRYIKMNPHKLFGNEYEYSIYIDGNFQQISDLSAFVNNINDEIGISMHKHSIRNCIYDEAKILKIYKKGNPQYIKNQVEEYKKYGFPTQYGMVEAGVIVTHLKNDIAKKILEEWWEEFLKNNSMRDQLSLPYILWKNNIPIEKMATLGYNVFKNPKIRRVKHNV